jgi:MFS transporter, DHA2 family, methylenomycin A resistance protein
LLAACVGFFIVSVDATIVNVALPAIARDLHAGISGLQWVVDGYTLTFACLLLSGGALGDRFGPGRVFAVGVTLFAVASAGCGAAPDSAFLVAARLVQGVGAALLMPTSLAMIRHAFDRDDARARAVAVWAAAGGAAVAAGPVIGGALIAIADWRAIFFVNLAVAPVAVVFAFRAKAGPGRSDRVSLDVPGQAASVVALSALVYGLVTAGQSGWTSAVVVGCAAVTVAAAGMFLLIESRAKSPMLPLRFFRTPTFSACTGVGLILNLAFYGMVFVLSLYFQDVRGYSALEAGLAFLPMTVTVTAANLLGGRLGARTGARLPIVLGQTLLAVGSACLLAVGARTGEWLLAVVLLPMGAGGGLAVPPLTSALLQTVPAAQSGVASGELNAARQVGGVIGVAVFGAVIGRISPHTLIAGLHTSAAICAVALVAGSVISWAFIPRLSKSPTTEHTASSAAAERRSENPPVDQNQTTVHHHQSLQGSENS